MSSARPDTATSSARNRSQGYQALERGKDHLLQSRHSEALAELDTAVAQHVLEAHEPRASCLQALGWNLDAVDDFTRAIAMAPDSGLYYQRAMSRSAVGDFAGCVADLNEALRLAGGNSDYERAYDAAAQDQGFANAAALYRSRLKLDSTLLEHDLRHPDLNSHKRSCAIRREAGETAPCPARSTRGGRRIPWRRLFWTLATCLALGLLGWDSAADIYDEWQLLKHGLAAEAIVTDAYEDIGDGGPRERSALVHYIEYEFGIDGATVEGVAPAAGEAGSVVRVVYLPSRPEINAPAELLDMSPSELLWRKGALFLIFGVLGLSFAVFIARS